MHGLGQLSQRQHPNSWRGSGPVERGTVEIVTWQWRRVVVRTKLGPLRPHHTPPPTNQAGVAGASDIRGLWRGALSRAPSCPQEAAPAQQLSAHREDTHKALGCSVSRTLPCHLITAGLLLPLLGPTPRPELAWREELDRGSLWEAGSPVPPS